MRFEIQRIVVLLNCFSTLSRPYINTDRRRSGNNPKVHPISGRSLLAISRSRLARSLYIRHCDVINCSCVTTRSSAWCQCLPQQCSMLLLCSLRRRTVNCAKAPHISTKPLQTEPCWSLVLCWDGNCRCKRLQQRVLPAQMRLLSPPLDDDLIGVAIRSQC